MSPNLCLAKSKLYLVKSKLDLAKSNLDLVFYPKFDRGFVIER